MFKVRQEANSWTHIDWKLKRVTPDMIDWFWSNMDKGFILWHPEDHRGFRWKIPTSQNKFIGAIHLTLQGNFEGVNNLDDVRLGLRFYDVADLPKNIADVIVYDHACLVGGVDLRNPDNPVESYRIHQCKASGDGVVGMSSAITPIVKDIEEEKSRLLMWVKHASGEIKNWEVFLPDLYKLWLPVKQPDVNIFHSLKVEKTATGVRYIDRSNM